ncbi:MAG: DUF485 domain-containing protein [Campylobacterota bacterium]|nr:DUF485 domain-containing protein [Campylobacterota bacterium]
MREDIVAQIKNHPKYQELIQRRSRFAWTLSILMLIVYYTFIMTIAFAPELLAIPLSDGSVMSIGIPIGIAIILFSFLLTGIYVHQANGVYDLLLEEVKRDIMKEQGYDNV